MKRQRCLLVLMLAFGAALAQETRDDLVEQEIRRLDRAEVAGVLHKDVAALEKR